MAETDDQRRYRVRRGIDRLLGEPLRVGASFLLVWCFLVGGAVCTKLVLGTGEADPVVMRLRAGFAKMRAAAWPSNRSAEDQ